MAGIPCLYCHKKFSRNTVLNKHVRSIHLFESDLKGDVLIVISVKRRFHDDKRTMHIQEKHGEHAAREAIERKREKLLHLTRYVNNNMFPCPRCNEIFVSPEQHTIHYTTHKIKQKL